MTRYTPVLAIILTLATGVAEAGYYGQRSWLWHNSPHKTDPQAGPGVNVYDWGYNYRAGGRHSTVNLDEDRTGWWYNGNHRSNTSTGTFHWRRFREAR